MSSQHRCNSYTAAELTLIHDAQYVQGVPHLGELRVFTRELIVGCSHVHHHGTFAGDFNVPQDIGDASDGVSDPTGERQEAFEVLVAFERCL